MDLTDDLKLDLYAATADALEQWEPRIKLEAVQALFSSDGKITLDLTVKLIPHKMAKMNITVKL